MEVADYLPKIKSEPDRDKKIISPPVDPIVRIVLDAGHGGSDPGATKNNLLEKDLTLDVIKRIKALLEDSSFLSQENLAVEVTRDQDTGLSLAERVAFANRFQKAYFVSVHFNSVPYTTAYGTETYYALPKSTIALRQIRRRMGLEPDVDLADGRSVRFAEAVQARIVEATGFRDRSTKKNNNLVVPREIVGPAILVESAYISNREEAERVRNPATRQTIAEGIAKGIRDYLELTQRNPFHGVQILEPAPAASTYEGPTMDQTTSLQN